MRLFEITPASNTSATAALINRRMTRPVEESKIRVNRASLEGNFDEILIFGRSADATTKSLTAIAQIHNDRALPISDMPSSFSVEQGALEENPTPPGTYVTLDRLG